jgi:hypothetical protein
MIPRFSNPHLLPSTEFTSRSQLFETDVADKEAYDGQLAAKLKELVEQSLGSLQHDGSPKRKKRKIIVSDTTDPESIRVSIHFFLWLLLNYFTAFCLLSSSLPSRPIVLDPKPPSPSK